MQSSFAKSVLCSFVVVLCSVVFPCIQEVFAQPRSSSSGHEKGGESDRSRFPQSKESYLEQLKQGKALTTLLSQSILSRPIDPETYILGPGDILQLTLRGELDAAYPLTVMPEGTIAIPTIGIVRIEGEPLTVARDKVRERLERSYRGVTFSLDLVQLRHFRVYVTGEVYQAGTYFAQAQDRVSDLIELAGGFTEWADLRCVEVRRADSTASQLDIQSFYQTGNLSENLLLKSGDLVYVSSISPSKDHVIVESNWEGFNIYPIRKGDSLLTFLRNSPILPRNVNFDNVRVIRNGEILEYNFTKGKGDIELKNGDRINFKQVETMVFVEGAILRPGPQSYFPNTKAMTYASNAGLTSVSGNLDNIRVTRANTGKVEKGRDVIVERGDHVYISSSKRELFKDYFQIITAASSLIVSVAVIRSLNN